METPINSLDALLFYLLELITQNYPPWLFFKQKYFDCLLLVTPSSSSRKHLSTNHPQLLNNTNPSVDLRELGFGLSDCLVLVTPSRSSRKHLFTNHPQLLNNTNLHVDLRRLVTGLNGCRRVGGSSLWMLPLLTPLPSDCSLACLKIETS